MTARPGLLERILARLLGTTCPGCGARVLDVEVHYEEDHGGEG